MAQTPEQNVNPTHIADLPVCYREFSGKVAIVTGAAQGIGATVAEHLSAQGMRVIALDLQFEKSHEFISIGGKDKEILCRKIDVSDNHAVAHVVDEIFNEFKQIDYLVHAAGVLYLNECLASSAEEWERTLSVNTLGTVNVLRACAKKMVNKRSGAIVYVGSNSSSTPRTNMAAYAASKAASTMMVKCLALEVAQFGVRCNVVAPGSTDTAMQRQLWSKPNDQQSVIDGNLENYRLGIPLKRIATTDQISAVIQFLLSDQANHITMEVLRVDGGATLGST